MKIFENDLFVCVRSPIDPNVPCIVINGLKDYSKEKEEAILEYAIKLLEDLDYGKH